MKTLDISGSVEQKLAAHALTEKLQSYFKLYPRTIAKDVCEQARKANVSPLEMIERFEKFLPHMVTDCLAETKSILQKLVPTKKDAGAKQTQSSESESVVNTQIRVDRSFKCRYPGFIRELMHPELESVVSTEYDMTEVELWLHDEQKLVGLTTGDKIYAYLKATDRLKKCLGYDDVVAIQKKSVAAFQKVFKNNTVVCWRSVARDKTRQLRVPYVFAHDVVLESGWFWVSDSFSNNRPAGCFPSQ